MVPAQRIAGLIDLHHNQDLIVQEVATGGEAGHLAGNLADDLGRRLAPVSF